MKSGRLFWGVFLVAIGLLALAERAGILTTQWGVALGLWPLVLLFWGIALLVGGKVIRQIAAGVAGLVLAYLAVAFFNFSLFDSDWPHPAITETQLIVEPPDTSVHRASFNLDSGAGIFTIADTTADLLAVSAETNLGIYELDQSASGNSRDFTVSLEGKRKGWKLGRYTNRVNARLHPDPVWDLEMNIGAAKLSCDLTPFVVEHLEVNAGASSIRITLGNRSPETSAHISAGASSIRIYIPEAAACELHVETALSSKHFPGFTKSGEGTYRTENFGSAASTISLNIDAGVSSITVERY
jgi:hypothetical protein